MLALFAMLGFENGSEGALADFLNNFVLSSHIIDFDEIVGILAHFQI